MDEFEKLLAEVSSGMERFVRYRLPSQTDADDVLQEVYLSAYRKFPQLKNKDAFKTWIISIARNKCNDYFRAKAAQMEISIEELSQQELSAGRLGISVVHTVRETLDRLGDKDKQILYLYFWKELPQTEIAKILDIPVGTVKSRLFTAKQHFKNKYPYQTQKLKGDTIMQKLPEYIPEYTIERLDAEPFSVRWEELQGWLIVPRVGQKLTWGMYDFPERKRTEYTEMEVIGKAEVHGIEGVEVVAMQFDPADYYRTGALDRVERRFVAQLTDTHSRYLAETHMEDGVRKCYTFLDGEAFLNNWGFGEDNCGNEVNLRPKGLLHREENCVTGTIPREVVDVVGRYRVTIGGKSYDTVCVMDIECYNDAVASEQYVDQNGRTVLWRRFNRDDWAIDRFGGKPWSEKLPDNERLTINGETYVHWYDCISDYIL
ncbi:MAG: sigma-70 family RNA polymerase sigma factor [Oscillospiraceae bacterium]|nr:sigma-70 family RNA polymerase sigma factor [Oscillospiraceae bacterium]